MKVLKTCLAAIFALSLTVGAHGQKAKEPNVKDALQKADLFELYSLDPNPTKVKPKESFHGWKVLGNVTVRDADSRKKLVDAFVKSNLNSDGKTVGIFAPRHGIRIYYEGKIYDFVISFEGLQAELYEGDNKLPSIPLTKAPQLVFDRLLRDEKVPLPPLPKKQDELPGFPKIMYNAELLDVTVRGDKPLLAIVKADYNKDKKEISWLVEVQADITFEDYVAIRNLWENGSSGGGKGPVAYFFNKDQVKLFKRDLKEEGELRNARKGDCIRIILDASDGFPDATSMEIRAPVFIPGMK
jgi:hypothetical protein